MRKKFVAFAVIIAVLMLPLHLYAQTTQNEKVGRWQVRHLKNSTQYSEANDTSADYSEEYGFKNCVVYLRRDKTGVRIIANDFEWRKGEVMQRGVKEKILGLGQLIDITKQRDGSAKVEVEFSAFVELLEDFGFLRDGTVLIHRGSNITDLLRKEDNEREIDVFYDQCREAAKELPREVRSAFFGYAGIK